MIFPSPSILVANKVTVISVDGGQFDEDTSNTWLQIPLPQDEAGIIVELQMLFEVESE